MIARILSAVWILAATPAVLWATVIAVDVGGGGDFTSIQPALDSASTGDTVLVSPGDYTGSQNRDLDYAGKGIKLLSSAGPDSTTIDCGGIGRAFLFDDGETSSAHLDGFTITGAVSGSAIRIGSASPTIRNCRILGNRTGAQAGAGIGLINSNSQLENVWITDNYDSIEAGGIYIEGGAPDFDTCLIAGNFTDGPGGGILVASSASPTFENCTIVGNRAGTTSDRGGGMRVRINGGFVTMNRTIVWGNRADLHREISAGAGTNVFGICVDVDTSGNGGSGAIVFVSNVLRDPHFCDPGYCKEFIGREGDWSLSLNSPCSADSSPCAPDQIGAFPVGSCGYVNVWTGLAGNELWPDPGNWSRGSTPNEDDYVQITTGGGVVVRLDQSDTIDALCLCGAGPTQDQLILGSLPSSPSKMPGPGGSLRFKNDSGGESDGDVDNSNNAGTATSLYFDIKIDSTEILRNIFKRYGDPAAKWTLVSSSIGGDGAFEVEGGTVVASDEEANPNKSKTFGAPSDTFFSVISVDSFVVEVAGTLAVEAGTLQVSSSDFRNEGTIRIDSCATLDLPLPSFTKSGSGSVRNTSTGTILLTGNLTGAVTLDNVGTIDRSGPDTSHVTLDVRNVEDESGNSGTIAVDGVVDYPSLLFNEGTISIGEGTLILGALENRPAGRIEFQGTHGEIVGMGLGPISNRGEIIATPSADSAFIQIPVDNVFSYTTGLAGSIVAQSTTMEFEEIQNRGTISADVGARINVTGPFTHDPRGLLLGKGTFDAPTSLHSGRISPGIGIGDAGTLTLDDGYEASAQSEFFVDILGTSPSQQDRLVITGSATWDGALHVNTEGFIPTPGDTFEIATMFLSPSMTFSCYSGLQPDNSVHLLPIKLSDRYLLVAEAGAAGNADPVAEPDTFATAWTQPLELSPLENDTDAEFDPLSVVRILPTPSVGGVAFVNDGDTTITFLPEAGFTGTGLFGYAVTDCNGGLDSALVAVSVLDPTSVSDEGIVPRASRLVGNAPNPFNPVTRIRYDLTKRAKVRLAVYDLSGREVAVLADGVRSTGIHVIDWWARDSAGKPVASGIYFARFESGGRSETRKMVLVR